MKKMLLMAMIAGCSQERQNDLSHMKFGKSVSIVVASGNEMIKEKRVCPDEMIFIEKNDMKFCIDQYEWPNRKNNFPSYGLSYLKAKKIVEASGKRLCTSKEWEAACLGPNNHKYYYGDVFIEGRCNDDAKNYIPVRWELMENLPVWEQYIKTLFKGNTSGHRAQCTNEYNTFDMLGNLAELVENVDDPYGYEVRGGFWHKTMAGNEWCEFEHHWHSPTFFSYEFGTRACSSIK